MGEYKLAPYERMGIIRQYASQWQRWEAMPLPAAERCLTEANAAWKSASRLEKCAEEVRFGTNKYHNH